MGGLSTLCSLRLSSLVPSGPFRVGVSTCISSTGMPIFPGNLTLHSSATVSAVLSPFWRRRKKKSPLFSARLGCRPAFISCARETMRLSWAWRKISVRRTAGTAPLFSMSAKTRPGPTLGSWSASPTRMSRASSGMACRRASIKVMSTIEHSSSTTAPQSSLSSAPLAKTTRSPSSEKPAPSRRCMVAASRPVSSPMRLAARPVGAVSSVVMPSES